ncbi:hypothetical protein Ari01nite_15380 [Paractinoplanes rishiriensis]|uniref:Uncharacterized protein n=1 Tax=Paractinoplanes rishiriensis TaxID=1050105 RepID=A0A919MSU1_9ACTN|nr:hypothetical protein Ari01nite_15380 [Actinoplanes rishiriensis]
MTAKPAVAPPATTVNGAAAAITVNTSGHTPNLDRASSAVTVLGGAETVNEDTGIDSRKSRGRRRKGEEQW